MGLQFEKVVIDAIVACLTAGFNKEINANAVIYGVAPFTLDFSTASRNFAVSHIDPSDIETSSLMDFPAGCVYVEGFEDTGSPRGVRFSGTVNACLDFYIRDRSGVSGFNSEWPNVRIGDAAISVLNAYQWPIDQTASVIFSRQTRGRKDRLVPLSDGSAQRLHIELQFSVFIK